MLTGFKTINEQAKQVADKRFTLSMGTSPFQEGVKFQVTDYAYQQAENDGKIDPKARVSPVLVTTVGNLFLSMLTRPKVNSDGQILRPNGTFNQAVATKIAEMHDKADGEILKAIVKTLYVKTIITHRTEFIGKADNRLYVGCLINFDFE